MMESLQLPMDLQWEMKTEPLPLSPLSSTSYEDITILDEDNFAEDYFKQEAQELDDKLATFAKLQEILILNEALNKEILFQEDQWLEQKVEVPFLDDYTLKSAGLSPVKVFNTEELIMDFDSMYNTVEYTHLTPPQTPPGNVIEVPAKSVETLSTFCNTINVIEEPQQMQYSNCIEKETIQNNVTENIYSFPMISENTNSNYDISEELAEVEELIRSRAKDLPDWNDDDSFGESSSSSSSSSGCLSPSSDCSYGDSKSSNDSDWYPNNDCKSSPNSQTKTKRKYSRTTEDRKNRKKEQNKNAATRYRQKKKLEIEEVLNEERALLDINVKLQSKYNDLKREKKYLKNLLRELYLQKK